MVQNRLREDRVVKQQTNICDVCPSFNRWVLQSGADAPPLLRPGSFHLALGAREDSSTLEVMEHTTRFAL